MTDNELVERVLNIITKLSKAYQDLISRGGNRNKAYEEDLDYMLQLVDLVEKQKAEIERLQRESEEGWNEYSEMQIKYDLLFDEAKALIKRAKAEAIKECIEKIKAMSGKVVMVNDGIEITDLTNYTISEYDLRNIKKEMVGE